MLPRVCCPYIIGTPLRKSKTADVMNGIRRERKRTGIETSKLLGGNMSAFTLGRVKTPKPVNRSRLIEEELNEESVKRK